MESFLSGPLAIFFGTLCAVLAAFRQYRKNSKAFPAQSSQSPPFKADEKRLEDVPPLEAFDLASTRPRPYRPWSGAAEKFSMTMGISRMPWHDWLLLDNKYVEEQKLRSYLLDHKHEGVTQALPGSEEACAEVLECVVVFLTKRYPNLFSYTNEKTHVHNSVTNRTFKIVPPYDIPPLEVAAQLAMDLNILIQGAGPDPEQHYLIASYSMAPAGWYLQERIGWPLYKIHGPVPLWEDKLRKSVEKFFGRLRVDEPVVRHNFFVQMTDVLFQQEPFASERPQSLSIDDVRIRHERQTLRRLPKTGAILFMVRTYMMPITELQGEPEAVRDFLRAVRAMPEEMASYKGRPIWGEVVENWCREVLEMKN